MKIMSAIQDLFRPSAAERAADELSRCSREIERVAASIRKSSNSLPTIAGHAIRQVEIGQ